MKGFLSICCLLYALSSHAQPVLSPGNFPDPGDTLFYLTDYLPDRIAVAAPGPKQFWNFSQLDAPVLEYTLVEPAASGQMTASFPNAEIVLQSKDGAESYYYLDNAGIYLLGRSESFQDMKVKAMSRFDQGLLELVAGMEYDDDLDVEAMYDCQIERNELPSEVADQLDHTVERIRLQAQLARRVTADAWGNLLIPGGQYDVLRVRIDDVCDVSVETQEGSSADWKAGDAAMGEELLGGKFKSYYRYYAKGIKGEVATLYLDPNGDVDRVTFRANPRDIEHYQTDPNQIIYAFPNPSYGSLRLRFDNLEPGEYSVRFYNILGKQLFEQSYQIDAAKTVRVDVSGLQKGAYLYALLDERGNKLVTKRIVVLKR